MKNLLFIFSFIFISTCTLQAQSFFKPLPKPAEVQARSLKLGITATGVQTTMNTFRPIANVGAYAVPGNIIMVGAGVAYEHTKWQADTQKWYCTWSVSAMGWGGSTVSSATGTANVSYGVMLGLLNNLIMIGPAINNNKVIGTIAIGVNINN